MAHRVVVVGGGFAGLTAARRLERRLAGTGADLRLVCPDDYMLYLPLLPQVAAGSLLPRSCVVSLTRRLRTTRLVPGRAIGVDLDARRLLVRSITGREEALSYDRLVLAPGSVTRTMDVPGLREWGRGMKTLAEAQFVRDHVLGRLEVAAASDDPAERDRLCRFVVVGGGYAGVETVANLELMTRALLRRFPRLDPALVRWHLVQHGRSLLPELGGGLGHDAQAVLEARGIRVDLGTSVDAMDGASVTLSGGRTLATDTVVWTAGVAPSPLMGALGLDTEKGRLVVGADLTVPGRPEVVALGDAAAVPDLVTGGGATCPPTAQHATRQAVTAADTVVDGLAGRPTRPYRHHDLGMLVDLGGRDAVAKPLGVGLAGLPAVAATRAYHLYAIKAPDAMRRVASNWLQHAVEGDRTVRMGFATRSRGRLAEFEDTADHLDPDATRRALAALDARSAPGPAPDPAPDPQWEPGPGVGR